MVKRSRRLPKSWTTVTRTSKIIALLLYFVLLGVGFYYGMQYQKAQDQKTLQRPGCPIYGGLQPKSQITPMYACPLIPST